MSKSYDMSKNKESIKEIKSKLESKKGELSKLEEQKQELLGAITELSGLNLDEKSKKVINDSLKQALEKNKEKGSEISDQMGEDIKSLETIKQDTQESMDSATHEKSSIEKKKKLLDRFGIGGALDSATGEINQNIKELGEINEDSIETMRELEKLSQKAGGL